MDVFGSLKKLTKVVFPTNSGAKNVELSAASQTGASPILVTIPDVGDATGTLVEIDAPQVLTGKSISGASNTLSAIPVAALATGALPAGVTVTSANIVDDAIVNADINASAAIALTKLAATTASRALISNGVGVVTASTTTATELGYVSGVTSSIQSQLGLKAPTFSPTFSGTVTLPSPFTIGANTLTRSGAHNVTLTTTGATAVTLPTAGTLATLAGTEVLTNKTLDDTSTAVLKGGNSSGATLSIGTNDANDVLLKTNNATRLTISKQANRASLGDAQFAGQYGLGLPFGDTASRPSAPGAGLVRYNSDTSSFEGYGTAWSPLGGGSSSGVNVVPSASQNGSSGWLATNATLATDTTAANNPLSGVTTSALSVASSTNGGYAALRWTMPAGLQNRPLNIDFWAKLAAASDYKVELYYNAASNYGGAYTRVILNSDVSSVSNLNGGSTQFRTFFVEQGQSFYELRLVRTAASSATAYFSNIAIGVQPQVGNGFAGTNWQSFTPGITGLPVSSISGLWLQDGQNAYYQIYGVASGAATTTIQVGLPTGQSIDAVFNIPAGTEGANFGTVKAVKSGVGYHQGTVTRGDSVTSLRLLDDDGTGTPYNATVPFTWSSGDNFSILAGPIAITGWSSNVTVADRAVEEYASNPITSDANSAVANSVSGVAGSALPSVALTAGRSATVRFSSTIQTTDVLILEIQPPSSTAWLPLFAHSSGNFSYQNQNATDYGMYLDSPSGTDVNVRFTRYAFPSGATYGVAGAAWTGYSTTKYRVRKVSGGASVGYPVGTRNIVGDTSGTAVPAGMIGEIHNLTARSIVAISANYTASATIGTLPSAGTWLIVGTAGFDGAINSRSFRMAVATNASNDSTGFLGTPLVLPYAQTAGAVAGAVPMPIIYHQATSATLVLYAKAQIENVGQTLTVSGYAVRIA